MTKGPLTIVSLVHTTTTSSSGLFWVWSLVKSVILFYGGGAESCFLSLNANHPSMGLWLEEMGIAGSVGPLASF